MESQMPETTHKRRSRPGGSVARNVVILAVALVVIGLVWFTGQRIQRLNRELAASEKKAQEMNERLRRYSEELEVALERARAERNRAESAEERASETAEELAETQQEILSVAEQREQARAEALRAKVETRKTIEELEAIERRRAAELDRMQEALNKIAPTKRTPAGMVMVLSESNFRFAFDKANLSAENREMLSRIAGILMASEGYRLFVDGHTDDQGNASYNQGLSMRRARAVRDYLVKAGLPDDVIEVHGYGKSQPLVKAKTREARTANRRVEIGIVDTIIHYEKRVQN
jgi:outer membrane protein OmpA-like peptidoglycan-associated protein